MRYNEHMEAGHELSAGLFGASTFRPLRVDDRWRYVVLMAKAHGPRPDSRVDQVADDFAANYVLRGRGVRPDVLVFDGQGYAHPRRFGIACHGGLVFDTPSVGCAKSILVGTHGPLREERGARAPLVHRREAVGDAVRLRARVQPVYISPGHLMDRDTAVRVVEGVSTGLREPETTRRAHRLVNAVRKGERAADA